MINDPYKVLGVSENSSDAELKKAYRNLSKRWHPDQNPNNQKEAEERFKDIQEAYRQIVDARERGTSAYGNAYQGSYGNQQGSYGGRGYANYGYGSFNDYFNQWQQYSSSRRAGDARTESAEEQAARNYINMGRYREALSALDSVEEYRRGARWYYYAAMAQQGMGNNVTALEFAKRASDMEPDNIMYASFMRQLSSGGAWYQRQNENYGFGSFGRAGSSRWCLSMLMLNLCCGMMGGGRVFWC